MKRRLQKNIFTSKGVTVFLKTGTEGNMPMEVGYPFPNTTPRTGKAQLLCRKRLGPCSIL